MHSIRKITPEKDLEYARKKVEADKQKKMLAEMKQKIEKDIGLVIYPEAVNIVYNNLPPDIAMEDIVTYKVTRDNAPKLEIPEQYQGMILAQYADGSYTLKDYMKIYDEIGPSRAAEPQAGEGERSSNRYTGAYGTPRCRSTSRRQLKILEIPEVAKGLQAKKEMMLTWKFYEDQVKNEVSVSDLEVQDYYNANQERNLVSGDGAITPSSS